jgi:hypothetical protein
LSRKKPIPPDETTLLLRLTRLEAQLDRLQQQKILIVAILDKDIADQRARCEKATRALEDCIRNRKEQN